MIYYLDQVDRLEERENIFFNDCKKKLIKTEDKEVEFVKIKEDYKKAIEDATEKVQTKDDNWHSLIYDIYTNRTVEFPNKWFSPLWGG